eukprot:TRINITY_DN6988_c0_g2_i3.p1 TRINITY_DN6988_c0_g2~~TRINITY_DN6988_c0_g2_i3.p1  ORF type:complete len:155 (+),score=12.85 TRINITY_DN6988_c0_g2_i3:365-829(+)
MEELLKLLVNNVSKMHLPKVQQVLVPSHLLIHTLLLELDTLLLVQLVTLLMQTKFVNHVLPDVMPVLLVLKLNVPLVLQDILLSVINVLLLMPPTNVMLPVKKENAKLKLPNVLNVPINTPFLMLMEPAKRKIYVPNTKPTQPPNVKPVLPTQI